MSRFSFSFRRSTRFFRPAISCSLGVALVGALLFSAPHARADEFSVLPPGDPIYSQLALLDHAGAAPKAAATLTRYEAALQTARAILDLQNQGGASTSRVEWRSILALTTSLKSELRQLGIDVEATRALATRNLQKSATKPVASAAPLSDGAARQNPTSVPVPKSAIPGSLLLAPQASGSGENPIARKSSQGVQEFQLLPHLRAESALQAVQRTGFDPFAATGAASGFSVRGDGDGRVESVASQTALSFDLSHYLTLRAANSKLNWNGGDQAPLLSPLLGAPLFAGANQAKGTGGGVDVNLGSNLKLSTEIEKLRANTGAAASRIGAGASLSAFQNRLSMNMSLSRVVPEDKSALPSTAAQLGASLDVTQRLSLSLLYQGLFAATPSNSASRVSGGVSLSF